MAFPREFRNAGRCEQAVLALVAHGVQGTILTSRHEEFDDPGPRHAHRTFRVGIFAHLDTSRLNCDLRSAATAPEVSLAGSRAASSGLWVHRSVPGFVVQSPTGFTFAMRQTDSAR